MYIYTHDLSNLTLSVYRDGASTTSLGNLCQCLTTLIVKIFFLISSLNQLCLTSLAAEKSLINFQYQLISQ